MSQTDASVAVSQVARESYGRIVAWLVSWSGDLALAEDCLGDALISALQQWEVEGIPRKPEAWLLTVARRRIIDNQRRQKTREKAEPDLNLLQGEALEAAGAFSESNLPDKRLELMFLCAHPDIPKKMRAPLMMQTVLGLDAQRIANTMLVSPTAMAQRLVRIKTKIRDLGISFALPPASSLGERVFDILEAVYGVYTAADGNQGLSDEAIWLSRLLVDLLPEDPETKGLYAILCFCESRRPARLVDGEFIPLDEQDTNLWNNPLRIEGEKAIWMASKHGRRGPFQMEAAIHSVHSHRAVSGNTDWLAINRMYGFLMRLYPTIGTLVAYAASFGRVGDAISGLEHLDDINDKNIERYQPYWAVRAWLLTECGKSATKAYERAIGLTSDIAARTWLQKQREIATEKVANR